MATKKTTTKKTTRRKPAKKTWMRNLRHTHVSIRLDDRKIELAPRGQRGDIAPIKKDEAEHEIFLQNQGTLFETLTTAEAKEVVEQQHENVQQRPHPALATIRNEYGEEYERVTTEPEFNREQGKTVAPLDEEGNLTINRQGIRRSPIPGTTENPLPDIPDHIAPEEQADWIARQRSAQGVEAGFGGEVKVTKEPTQKT